MSAIATEKTSDEWSFIDEHNLGEMRELSSKFKIALTDHQILVNIDAQRLHLIAFGKYIKSYLVSTSMNGVGQKEGTGQTPLGLHVVKEKIGDGADPFEIFKSRVSTREIAVPDGDIKAIIGRILWLQGVQPGFNVGKDLEGNVVDTYERYIYIHGTNDIASIGQPVSAGCVRMKPDDVIDLFNIVSEETPVYIYKC